MPKEKHSDEPNIVNRRKVLTALGTSAVGATGLAVGSASAKSDPATVDISHQKISDKVAKKIIRENAMGVLRKLWEKGIINEPNLSVFDFNQLKPSQAMEANGFISMQMPKTGSGKESKELLVTKKLENGNLTLVVDRTSGESYATLDRNDEITFYGKNYTQESSSNSVQTYSSRSCNNYCGGYRCLRTVLNLTDLKGYKLRYNSNLGRCVVATTKCCQNLNIP